MRRVVRLGVTSLIITVLIFLGYGGWRTATTLEGVLRVGGETAQGDGWPAPESVFDIGYVGDPLTAFAAPFEDVTIDTDLGPMPAWLIAPGQPSDAASTFAIIVHGIGGRRENGYRFVPPLRQAGLTTLLISYRNDRDAPRDPSGLYAFGLTEWRDLEAAVSLSLERGAQSIVLLGESMGGGIVGQFMRRSALATHVSALLFDAPAFDFRSVLLSQMRRAGSPVPTVLAPIGMTLFALRNPFSIADADVTDAVAQFAGPVFISHGTGDRIVPVSVSDRVVERRTAWTEYLRTEADHIVSWKTAPDRYDAAMAGFLAALDAPN